jgi:hypothetical protein
VAATASNLPDTAQISRVAQMDQPPRRRASRRTCPRRCQGIRRPPCGSRELVGNVHAGRWRPVVRQCGKVHDALSAATRRDLEDPLGHLEQGRAPGTVVRPSSSDGSSARGRDACDDVEQSPPRDPKQGASCKAASQPNGTELHQPAHGWAFPRDRGVTLPTRGSRPREPAPGTSTPCGSAQECHGAGRPRLTLFDAYR